MSINPDDRPWPRTLSHEGFDWPADEQRVLVPFREAVNVHETSLLGASIAFGSDGELYLLHTVDADGPADTDDLRAAAGLEWDLRERFPVPVVSAEQPFGSDVVERFVESRGITTTLTDRAERSFFARGDDRPVASGCHGVVGTRMGAFEPPASILVPVARGPHSGLATRVAEAVARAYDCWLELFHVVTAGTAAAERDADRLLDAYDYRLADDVTVDQHVVTASSPADAIVEHAEYHDLTVLGAPEKGRLRRFLFGSTTDTVTANADHGPILTAHRDGADSFLSRLF